MKELMLQERYECFIDTFQNIGTFLLEADVEEIGYRIFEEFDGDCVSFLHEDMLTVLFKARLIDETVFRLSLELAIQFRAVENTPLWNAASVKQNPRWRTILLLADRIRLQLNIS